MPRLVSGVAPVPALVELRVTRSLIEGGLWRGVIGLVTVRAPVPPIHAGVRIEDYHPSVPVPVRDKDFIRLGINCHIGGLAQMPLYRCCCYPFRVVRSAAETFPCCRISGFWFSLAPFAPRPAIQTLFL